MVFRCEPRRRLKHCQTTVAQDVLGVALVDAVARQLRMIDQQPADMAPPETFRRAVRIERVVGMLMVQPMHTATQRIGVS